MTFTKRTYRAAFRWHRIAAKLTQRTIWHRFHHHSAILIHRRAARAGVKL